MGKYSISGSQKFDSMIDDQLEQITNEILKIIPEAYISAIILGGGYGRGEGGVLKENGQEKLYNDYDLSVVLKNISYKKKQKFQHKINYIHEKFTPLFKIDVDVGPLQTIKTISQAPYWMMWYELKYASMVLWGNKNISSYFPDYSQGKMPFMEAYRLLLNRGVGLLLCQEKFKNYSDEEAPEFILRNIRKAQLAMGDAFLVKKHMYHFSYQQRYENIKKMRQDIDLQELQIFSDYEIAYKFKMTPHRPNKSQNEYLDEYQTFIKKYERLFTWVFTDAKQDKLDYSQYFTVIQANFAHVSKVKDVLKNIYKNLKGNELQNNITNLTKHPRFILFLLLPKLLFNTNLIEYQQNLSFNKCLDDNELFQKYVKVWEKNN